MQFSDFSYQVKQAKKVVIIKDFLKMAEIIF